MSEHSVNWSDLVAKYGIEEKKPKEEKKKPVANVVTWKYHRCESKHKTASTFLRCALKKYTPNVSGKLTLPSIRISGKGVWAIIETGSSESYYSYHNNKELNHQHVIYDITLFDSLDEAAAYRDKLMSGYSPSDGYWRTNVRQRQSMEIVKVML